MADETKTRIEKAKHVRNRAIRTDSLLRETSSHYIRQIGDADRKARIMLVVTSVMISIGVTIITKMVSTSRLAWISAGILIISNVITLILAIRSIKPTLKGDVAGQTEDNILHYKTCTQHPLDLYTEKMVETLDDDNKKRDAIIQELYYYGNLLDEKYKHIENAYRIFLWGMIATIASYLIIFVIQKLVGGQEQDYAFIELLINMQG